MNPGTPFLRKIGVNLFVLLMIITILASGCSFDLGGLAQNTPTAKAPPVSNNQNLPMAMVTFIVNVPSTAPPGDIGLELLDEVTGLALNPQRYKMTEEKPGVYTVQIPITVGSVIKYRYLRQENTLGIEYTSFGNQVRYRMAVIQGPMLLQDTVTAWTDYRYPDGTGKISGQVVNAETNTPVPSALVVCAGSQTLTASDGSFLLEGIVPGTHNMVVYSMDGAFQPFQQGALVAENASTSAFIQLIPANKVKVTFVVQIPESNIEGLPVRMIGNTTALGNTFADLEGGFSVLASRAPLMTMMGKGVYSLTLELPVGLDLRYKYTLGDGFWNAEHSSDSFFRVRQLIVPSSDFTQTDIVDTWQSGNKAPIVFSVQAPANTPKEDSLSIQFNPFGWTPPLPMWPLGNNRWVYVLYSPLDAIVDAGYRYCRNDQCGSADDLATIGVSAFGHPFTASKEEQNFQDEIERWIWWNTDLEPTTIIAPEIEPRGSGFVAGVEFSQHYLPSWQPFYPLAIQNVQQLGANWVILSPTWHYTHLTPVVLEGVPGVDPIWQDVLQSIQTAQQNNFSVSLFPRLVEPQPGLVWQMPINDDNWWRQWFERYRIFILNFADLAEQTGASTLILGGNDVLPALPGGLAADGSPSGVPADAEEFWADLLQELRGRYSGQIAWALPYPQGLNNLPDWINEADLIYVLFSAQLSESPITDEGILQLAFGDLIDRDLLPIFEQTGVPMVIGVDYPSADGAATACILVNAECIEFDSLSRPQADHQEISVDLVEQAHIYGAAFNAVYKRDWITGLISRGFYPPAALQDKSSSIHGKPAADIVWYWFPKILGR